MFSIFIIFNYFKNMDVVLIYVPVCVMQFDSGSGIQQK